MNRKRIAALMAGVDQVYQQGFTLGMHKAAQEQDIDLCIFNCQGHADGIERDDRGESAIFTLPDLSMFDGVVLLLETIPTEACSEQIKAMLERYPEMPLVTIDCQWGGSVSITFDDQESVRQLMKHLLEQHGMRRFAMVTGPAETDVAQKRRDAAMEMIRGYNRAELPADAVFDGRWVREGGYRAADALLKREGPLPEVIVCGNDDMAFGVVERLRENKLRIPEDVAVTGFDALDEAVGRGLTTIRRPVQEAGEYAVSVLTRWMQRGKPNTTDIRLSTQVIYGSSCGCAEDAGRAMQHVRQLSAKHRDVERLLLKGVSFFSGLSSMAGQQEAGDQIARFAEDWGAEQFHICIAPDFVAHDAKAPKYDYPEEMLLLSGWNEGEAATLERFPARELLPLLSGERKKPLTLVFLPLYSGTGSIGYAVLDMAHASGYAMYALLTLISASLSSMALHAALEDMSTHDALTGLLNRRGFNRVIPAVFEKAQKEHRCFAVISCDMNGMKQINDSYGHHRGDEAICRMSRVFRELEAQEMICVHISGDEFVAAGIVDSDAAAREQLEMLRKGMERINREEPWVCDISASIGVFSGVPSANDEVALFMRMADRQMYQDKEKSRRK